MSPMSDTDHTNSKYQLLFIEQFVLFVLLIKTLDRQIPPNTKTPSLRGNQNNLPSLYHDRSLREIVQRDVTATQWTGIG